MESKPVNIRMFSKNFANEIRDCRKTKRSRFYTYYSKALRMPIESHFLWKDRKTGFVYVEDLVTETIFKIDFNYKNGD